MMDGYSEIEVRDVKDLRLGDIFPLTGLELTENRLKLMADIWAAMGLQSIMVQRKVEPEAPVGFILTGNIPEGSRYLHAQLPAEWQCKTFREVRTLSEEQSRAAFEAAFRKTTGRSAVYDSKTYLYIEGATHTAWQLWKVATGLGATGAKVETAPEKVKSEPCRANEHKLEGYQYFLGLFADAVGATGSPNMDEVLAKAIAQRKQADPSPALPLVAKLRELVGPLSHGGPGGNNSSDWARGYDEGHNCLAYHVQKLLDSYQEEARSFVPGLKGLPGLASRWIPEQALGTTCYYTVEKQEGGKS